MNSTDISNNIVNDVNTLPDTSVQTLLNQELINTDNTNDTKELEKINDNLENKTEDIIVGIQKLPYEYMAFDNKVLLPNHLFNKFNTNTDINSCKVLITNTNNPSKNMVVDIMKNDNLQENDIIIGAKFRNILDIKLQDKVSLKKVDNLPDCQLVVFQILCNKPDYKIYESALFSLKYHLVNKVMKEGYMFDINLEHNEAVAEVVYSFPDRPSILTNNTTIKFCFALRKYNKDY